MKLFLASTIKQTNVVKALENFVGTFKDKSLLYIPTAANSEEGFGVWKTGTTYKTMNSLCENIKPLELEYVRNEEAQRAIQNADILFLAGGYPVYLSYWLYRRNVVDLIKERLKENLILIGASAGAMVCSKTLKTARFLDNDPFSHDVPGMGIINYEIWPHYIDEHKQIIENEYKGIEIKPLRDGEYIIIDK